MADNSPNVSRPEYMRNQGFALSSDVAHRHIDSVVHELEIPEIQPTHRPGYQAAISESEAGMYAVVRMLSQSFMNHAGPRDMFYARYGVTDDDIGDDNKFHFQKGFGDQGFPWEFTGLVASEAVAQLEEDGHITPEQHQAMSLHDWADVIGSGWLSDVVHDLALTTNAVYRDIGVSVHNYAKPGKIAQWVTGNPAERSFDTSLAYDETTDRTYAIATVTKPLRQELRRRMDRKETVGCPVARHAGTVAVELAQNDPHFVRLVESGDVVLGVPSDGKVRFFQEQSPIDRAMVGLAHLIDQYADLHGTPLATPLGHRHEHLPATNVLFFDGDITAVED